MEELHDFLNNHGEIELNKRYVQEVMVRKQEPQAQTAQSIQPAQPELQMVYG